MSNKAGCTILEKIVVNTVDGDCLLPTQHGVVFRAQTSKEDQRVRKFRQTGCPHRNASGSPEQEFSSHVSVEQKEFVAF